MFTRISSAAALLGAVALLAGCSGDGNTLADAEREAAGEAAEAGKVDCALAGSSEFDILTDGRGLAPADGFDETSIKILSDGMIEVKSGDDSYRLPADIKASAAK
jgi:hypothetical protein